MRTLGPTKTDKDKAHELTNIGVGVVFVCLCLCMFLSLSVWVEGANTPFAQVLQAEVKKKKAPCYDNDYDTFDRSANTTQVLQAEVKKKKAPCYAPKRKVILDEYPDEVCSFSSSNHQPFTLSSLNIQL